MERTGIFEKLNEVFRDIFDDETITVGEETTAADIEGWDSLTHINLLATIEDEFDIKFEMKDIVKMKNVGEMADLIEDQLK
ncbi:MAG: acyl carrier protein [Oscillospiraceae bacterium]|nr:acyl carrier protein [Oscillospiraceae bacterium]